MTTALPEDIQSLQQRRDQLLGAGATLFYQTPVHIVRGEGAYLYDADGREYIDLYNNVPCVGHANPHVVNALHQQAATLNVHSRYLHEGILDYAERLLNKHHDGIQSVVFSCTGTEANEIAMMMARIATGGRGIICTDAAYHGNSAEVRKLTRTRSSTNNNAEAAGDIRSFPFPQRYRAPASLGGEQPRESDTELKQYYLDQLQSTINSFQEDNIPLAGLLVCPILANEGLPQVPKGFMAAARDMIHQAGGVFIADEVQAGLCRSGHWWGYEAMDVIPDIVTMGKPLGNGYPIAATAASKDIVDQFRATTRYFNTFASSPLQAAAGSAVLDVIEREGLQPQAAEVGEYLHQQLKTLVTGVDCIGDLRAQGLFVGIEWVKDQQSREADMSGAVRMANLLKDRGFLLSNAGALGNVIKIRPPLVFEKHHADRFLNVFEDCLQDHKDQ